MRCFCASMVTAILLIAGCQSSDSDIYQEDLKTASGEPAYITIQHCLISFEGTGTSAIRSREEAEQLANELYEKAKNGEDFAKIIARYTDDSAPGIYRMSNTGFPGDKSSKVNSKKIYTRDGMVPAFGDVGFTLEVDEFGMAPYDEDASQYGWHIIKRIR